MPLFEIIRNLLFPNFYAVSDKLIQKNIYNNPGKFNFNQKAKRVEIMKAV